jgi:hypothetical protein
VRFDGFTSGGFYSFPSLNAASQLCMNYSPELVEGAMPKAQNPSGGEKARMVLTPTPGLNLYGTLPKTPCRGVWPGQERLFAVGHDHLYEVTGPTSFTDHGSVGTAGLPVSMIPNGNQLFVVSAGYAYCDSGSGVVQCQFSTQLYDLTIDATTHGLTGDAGGIFDSTDVGSNIQITGGTGFTVQTLTITSVVNGQAFSTGGSWGTDGSYWGTGIEWLYSGGNPEYVTALQGAFLDGTFFAPQPDSKIVYYSAVNDGTSWDPLSFFSKEAYPDNVAGIIADHEQLYLLGSLESAEVWGDTGNTLNPFQRNPSYFMHYGIGATWSVSRLSTGIAWIGGDVRRGERVAYLASGFVPQRISTAAIEKAWALYGTVTDAIAYTVIMDGHESWVVNFPTGQATWVYDVGLGEWHQRGYWKGVSTTIANNIVPGTTDWVTPASIANIAMGQYLTVANADGSHLEVVQVTGLSGGTFNAVWTLPKTGPGITVFAAAWGMQLGAFHACIGVGSPDETHFVGDYSSGNIYQMSAAYSTDNGVAIHRRRRAPHMTNEKRRRFYGLIEIDADTDKSDVNGAPPRVRWLRCGSSRDRILQIDDDGAGNLTLSYSDDNTATWKQRNSIATADGTVTIAAMYIEFTEGTG